MENEKDAYRSKLEEQIFNKICAGVEFEELTLEEKQAYEEDAGFRFRVEKYLNEYRTKNGIIHVSHSDTLALVQSFYNAPMNSVETANVFWAKNDTISGLNSVSFSEKFSI